jgi:hypothetical protein
MSDVTQKPNWPYDISLEEFSKISQGVYDISHYNYFNSVDSFEDGIQFGKGQSSYNPPRNWGKYFEFRPSYSGLLKMTLLGEKAKRALDKIVLWEAQNEEDLRDYKRLKEKLGM